MTGGWRPADIGDQSGRSVVVTGPSPGGIGHHVALELARRGARVVLAGRDPDRLTASADAIRDQVPAARLERLPVDLADLASVRRAGADAAAYGALDVLVHAGVTATPRTVTTDGLDRQLATHHFGPFLLTGLLLPRLVAGAADAPPGAGGSRVVTVSSVAHRLARGDPLGVPRRPGRPSSRWGAYARSKLANLLFTYELDRRCHEAGLPVRALAAHPGVAGTPLGGPASILDAAGRGLSRPAALGAWPVLMAATADLPGGTYVGPGGLGELSGAPRVVTSSDAARDPEAQRRWWQRSEEVTGLAYP